MRKLTFIFVVLLLVTSMFAASNWSRRGYVINQYKNGHLFTYAACLDSLQRNRAMNRLAMAGVDSSDLWFFEIVIEANTTGGLSFDSLNCVDVTGAMRVRYQAINPY